MAQGIFRQPPYPQQPRPRVFAAGAATIETSFTADAVLRRDQSGSFSADAVVAASVTASFTGNAVIAAAGASSFTADALIVREILRDTFTRTVASGLGTSDNGVTYFRHPGLSSGGVASVNGSYALTDASTIVAFVGYPSSLLALAQFDFFVPQNAGADNQLFYQIDLSNGTDAVYFFAIPVGGSDWSVQVGEGVGALVNFTADDDTWYRAKAWIDNAGGTYRVKVWKVGDAEPDWGANGSGSGSFVGDYALWLGLGDDATENGLDNLFVWTATGTTNTQLVFTADAILRATQSASFTADAFIPAQLSADAVIARGQTASFSADAFIAGDFTMGFGAYAVISAAQSASFSADAVISRSMSASLAADAVVAASVAASLTADAAITSIGVCVWTTPGDTVPIDPEPTLAFTMPDAAGPMHFHMELDTVSSFDSGNLRSYKSNHDQTDWEYWDGGAWQPIPAGGVSTAYSGNEARFTLSDPLTTGLWYRRVRGGA